LAADEAGTCLATGTLGFSATVHESTTLTNVTVTIGAGGSCSDNVSLHDTLSLNLSGNGSFSCDAGLANVVGSMSWGSGSKSGLSGVAVGGPGTLAVYFSGVGFQGEAQFAWNPSDVTACAETGVTGASLTGVVVFATTG
jgi:hypothetical protein